MKTQLGISVGLLGALACFAGIFGGYIPIIIVAGYILLFEENSWLRKTAVKAVTILIIFSFIISVINLIPDFLSWIDSLLSIFKGSFNYPVISSIVNTITKALNIIKVIIFLVLGVRALRQGSINIPFVDKIIDKYM